MTKLAALIEKARREETPALMGVLNVTPDSFSDGGLFASEGAARARIDRLLEDGADIIDIGSESTRPGASAVPAAEQIRRAGAAIDHAVSAGALVSIDTTNPEVARFALDRGAALVNDVSCLLEPALGEVARLAGVPLVQMHSRGLMVEGSAAKMPGYSAYPDDGYADVVVDVSREWRARREIAVASGMIAADVWFDPGLGFHKNAAQSLELLSRLDEFRALETVIVVGPSRKSFIGALDGSGPEARLGGTIAACLVAADRGADVLRVHDVRDVRQALLLRRAARRASRALDGAAAGPAPPRNEARC